VGLRLRSSRRLRSWNFVDLLFFSPLPLPPRTLLTLRFPLFPLAARHQPLVQHYIIDSNLITTNLLFDHVEHRAAHTLEPHSFPELLRTLNVLARKFLCLILGQVAASSNLDTIDFFGKIARGGEDGAEGIADLLDGFFE
jgi:hypothetical protein